MMPPTRPGRRRCNLRSRYKKGGEKKRRHFLETSSRYLTYYKVSDTHTQKGFGFKKGGRITHITIYPPAASAGELAPASAPNKKPPQRGGLWAKKKDFV